MGALAIIFPPGVGSFDPSLHMYEADNVVWLTSLFSGAYSLAPTRLPLLPVGLELRLVSRAIAVCTFHTDKCAILFFYSPFALYLSRPYHFIHLHGTALMVLLKRARLNKRISASWGQSMRYLSWPTTGTMARCLFSPETTETDPHVHSVRATQSSTQLAEEGGAEYSDARSYLGTLAGIIWCIF